MTIISRSGFVRSTRAELATEVQAYVNSRISDIAGALPRATIDSLRMFAQVMAGAVSDAVYGVEKWQSDALDNGHPTYATGAALDDWCYMYGLTRRAATYGEYVIRVTGQTGAEVTVGALLQSESGLRYAVLAGDDLWYIPVGGYLDVTVRAVAEGPDSALDDGATLVCTSPIAGIDSEAVVQSEAVEPLPAETDDTLRDRLRQHIAYPEYAGNPEQLISWAESVSGIAKAWCRRAWPEPGYATLLITSSGEDGPVPDGGGAWNLRVAASGLTGGVAYIRLSKAEVLKKLGRAALAEWYRSGTIWHNLAYGQTPTAATIDATGLREAGEYWEVRFASNPSPAITEGAAVNLLDTLTETAYEAILGAGDAYAGENNLPVGMQVRIQYPEAQEVDLTIAIPEDSETIQAAIAAQIAALLDTYGGPGETITAWQIHQAISEAAGHTDHRLESVDGSAEGSVTAGAAAVLVVGTITWEAWT